MEGLTRMKRILVFFISLVMTASAAGLLPGCEKGKDDKTEFLLMLLGMFRPADTYTVTFDSQGGNAVDSQLINHGGTVTEPAAPLRDGYIFGGWFKEAECENEWAFAADTVTGNATLFACWTWNHAITVSSGMQKLPSGEGLFNFGEVADTLNVYEGITVKNIGSGNITFTSITLSSGNTGEFKIITAGMSASLAPDHSAHFLIGFDPSSIGEKNAIISIQYNPAMEPYTFMIRGIAVGCVDNDGDGYGDGSQCLGFDCDDNDSSRHPGVVEICGNYIDDDCDDVVDEGCPIP
jgi:uncharacterized repeat protein (TIGR02543 family)